MNKKFTGIMAYGSIFCGTYSFFWGWRGVMPLIVWGIVFTLGDKEGAKLHLNQSLVFIIVGLVTSVIGIVPILGAIISCILYMIFFVCGGWGIISTIYELDYKFPIIGDVKIIK